MMAELPGILVRWVCRPAAAPGTWRVPAHPRRGPPEFEASSDRVHRWVIEECQIVTRIPDKDGPAGNYRLISPGQGIARRTGHHEAELHQMFRDWSTGTARTP